MIDDGSASRSERPISRYREFAPPPALSGHLVCTWTQAIGAGGTDYVQRILPDGCADVVWIGEAAPVVAGPATRVVTARLPAGGMIIGARFRPGLAPGFLGPPSSELVNREIPLIELWGYAAHDLTLRMAEAPSVAAKLLALESGLARRPVDAGRADSLTAAAVAWLARHPAGRIDELGGSLGISTRQLQRRFVAAVGYGPKTLQRILRLQRALALAGNTDGDRMDLVTLALEAGYADQAHMSREVRALAGQPPTRLLARAGSTLSMSDLFKTAGEVGG